MSSKKKAKRKVVRYKRPFYLNIGLVIFLFLLVYLGIQVHQYQTGEGVKVCEVVSGELVKDTTFTGIVWRDEQITTTETAGYINYYLREKKAGCSQGFGMYPGRNRRDEKSSQRKPGSWSQQPF